MDKQHHGEWFELTSEDWEWVGKGNLFLFKSEDGGRFLVSCECHAQGIAHGWRKERISDALLREDRTLGWPEGVADFIKSRAEKARSLHFSI